METTETQNTKKGYGKYLVVLVLGAVLVYGLVTVIVNERLELIANETRVLISEQNTVLTTISETTARNGADSVTESIVRDCPMSERSRFDTLLGSLDAGLSRADLTELERLFGRCGSFYSERKSVMVSRLDREFQVYESYIEQLEIVQDQDLDEEYLLTDWQNLVELEKRQSELFTQLVSLQDNIITALLDGKTTQSEEITNILGEVREVQEALFLANSQAKDIRTQLTEF